MPPAQPREALACFAFSRGALSFSQDGGKRPGGARPGEPSPYLVARRLISSVGAAQLQLRSGKLNLALDQYENDEICILARACRDVAESVAELAGIELWGPDEKAGLAQGGVVGTSSGPVPVQPSAAAAGTLSAKQQAAVSAAEHDVQCSLTYKISPAPAKASKFNYGALQYDIGHSCVCEMHTYTRAIMRRGYFSKTQGDTNLGVSSNGHLILWSVGENLVELVDIAPPEGIVCSLESGPTTQSQEEQMMFEPVATLKATMTSSGDHAWEFHTVCSGAIVLERRTTKKHSSHKNKPPTVKENSNELTLAIGLHAGHNCAMIFDRDAMQSSSVRELILPAGLMLRLRAKDGTYEAVLGGSLAPGTPSGSVADGGELGLLASQPKAPPPARPGMERSVSGPLSFKEDELLKEYHTAMGGWDMSA